MQTSSLKLQITSEGWAPEYKRIEMVFPEIVFEEALQKLYAINSNFYDGDPKEGWLYWIESIGCVSAYGLYREDDGSSRFSLSVEFTREGEDSMNYTLSPPEEPSLQDRLDIAKAFKMILN